MSTITYEHRSKCSMTFVQSTSMGTLIPSAEAATSEALLHPPPEQLELAAVLHALSDPMRLKIVAALAHAEEERTCGSFELPVVKSTCTHHFRVLREAGVIRQRLAGTTPMESPRPAHPEP